MKNSVFYKLSSKVLLSIKGKNIDNFIKKLNKNKIEILNIKYISYKEINILIKKEDLNKVIKIKSVYNVEVIDSCEYLVRHSGYSGYMAHKGNFKFCEERRKKN